jgi:hypothetical protein
MRLKVSRLGNACARSRALRDEEGIALILALGVLLVLALMLATALLLTSSSTRDAHRSNGTQKAYDLAEAGINNALAVLNAHYPTTTPFPGDFSLLSGSGLGQAQCGVWPQGCLSTYASGSVTWNGTLAAVTPPGSQPWKYEWRLIAVGRVSNPTGPAGDITRTATAVVPVVYPDTTSIDPAKSSLNWIYGKSVTFNNSLLVQAPVYATGDLTFASGQAAVDQWVPADVNTPRHKNAVVVLGDLHQNNTGSNQNKIGYVVDTTAPDDQLQSVYIGGACYIGNEKAPGHACVFNSTASGGGVVNDWIFAQAFTKTTLDTPAFTCCDSGDPSRVVTAGAPVAGTLPAGSPSTLGFWYFNSDLGPVSPCATYYTNPVSGVGVPPLAFDTKGVAPTVLGADYKIDQSATKAIAPFDLTPPGVGYDCELKTADGQLRQLSWNGTGSSWTTPAGDTIPSNTLHINGTIFIDGSATSTSNSAEYLGLGALILSGTFYLGNSSGGQRALCVHVSGNTCNTGAAWDPNLAGMFIFAGGDFNTDLSNQKATKFAGDSIVIEKGQLQGGLFAAFNIDAGVSGTLTDGPLISAYGNVQAGQSGTLTFPAISFPTSGTDGFTGPFPIGYLLPPRQFGGS